MSLIKVILLCVTGFMLSCNSGTRSIETDKKASKTDVNRVCIPEAELFSAGIIGGAVVKPSDADSKYAMMLITILGDKGSLCTASAIGKKVLITAAHCIVGDKSNSYIVMHPSRSCESGYNKNIHTAAISSMVVHEGYKNNVKAENIQNDIALIFLEQEIPEGYTTYKIANPSTIVKDTPMYLYGYGRIGSNKTGSQILRKIKMSANDYEIQIENKIVKITQNNGAGICQGDSGGASLVTTDTGALDTQILGINSTVFGPESDICSDLAYQTLVYPYKSWIESKISNFEKSEKR